MLEFSTEAGGEIRVLGSCLGEEADIRNRTRRAGMLWGKDE